MKQLPVSKATALWAGIGMIWLFHISGLIGIALGHQQWFIEKTPLNLTVSLLVFALLYPIKEVKSLLVFFAIALIGMAAEWMGVHWGWFFGDYEYGQNFGPKFQGVPYLIGLYWALLTLATSAMAQRWVARPWLQWGIAAALMVGLDMLLEQWAPIFDFWTFDPNPPLDNYLSWFVLGFLLQVLWHKWGSRGNYQVSLHLFAAQVLFFGLLFAFY